MATKYKRAGAGNWSADASWSTTSGGSADTTKPVDGDAAICDGNSGDLTVDAASAATSLVCTGYTGTLLLSNSLTLKGTLTLVSGMTFTPGSNTVILNATATITTGGKAFGNLSLAQINGAMTFTFADDVTVNGTFNPSNNGTATIVMNGQTIHCKGAISPGSNSSGSSGTTTISIDGSTNQSINLSAYDSANSGTYRYANPVVIASTGGTVTFTNNYHALGSSFTKTGGTVDFTTNTSTVRMTCTTNVSINLMSATFYGLILNWYGTITTDGDITVNGTFTAWSGNGITTINGNTLKLKGTVNGNASSSGSAGTTTFSIEGSGDQNVDFRTNAVNYFYANPIVIASTGGTVYFTNLTHRIGGSLTRSSGTVDFTTNTSVVELRGTTNANLLSATFYGLSFVGYKTVTLDGDVTVNDAFTAWSSSGAITINGNKLNLKGSVAGNSGGGGATGTTEWHINGTGTQAVDFITNSASYRYGNPIYIENSGTVNFNSSTSQRLSGNVTFNGTGTYNLAGTLIVYGGTWTYTAGTVAAGTSTLSIAASCTLNTNGISWYNITFSAANTTTINSLLTSTNLMRSSAATTFAGTGGVSAVGITIDGSQSISAASNTITVTGTMTVSGTLTATSATIVANGASTSFAGNGFTTLNLTVNASKTLTLASTKTYTVTGAFTMAHGAVINASSGGSKALLTLGASSTQSVDTASATDIDSSGGKPVYDYAGTLSNTTNWFAFTQPAQAAAHSWYA